MLSQELGVSVFTTEYDILILLHEAGEASFTDLYFHLQTSGSTIGRKLGRLRDKGLIKSRLNETDLRRRKFVLPDNVRKFLDTELAYFSSWEIPEAEPRDKALSLVKNLKRDLGVEVLAQKYKLIIGCYSQNGPSASALLEFAAISQGSFFTRLKELQENGPIHSVKETDDQRKSRIYLSEHVAGAVAYAHAEMYKWASRTLPSI
ncbi:MarR family transcriptional regulator [Hyphomonas sp.]|jgi:DNA-binding MarR family transcriptional regulator|uniref:MarR family transcriptional regulator n=1 Tax=Hyphomonas sp. TaxID=87 RepID=UPI0035277ECD